MTFGTVDNQRYGICSKESAFAIMDLFYSEGGNFIDTANTYRHGQSEQWVGEWMRERNVRDEIVLATKYTSPSPKNEEKGKRMVSNYAGNGTKSMKTSLEHSLKNLGTDYIDLFYVHWWDFTVSVPELMHSLNDLVVAGKVHYLGISDTPAWMVSKCNQYARDHGLRQFVVYQGMWNAAMRDFERDIIPMCASEGMGMCPYGVLNQGRFQTEEGFKAREKSTEGRNLIPLSDHDKAVSKALEGVAKKNGEDTKILDVALAYVLQKAPYVFPIVGGRKVEHIQGSIDGLKIALIDEEIDEVEKAYDFDHGFPHTFLSGTLFAEHGTVRHRAANGPADVGLLNGLGSFDYVERPKAIRPHGPKGSPEGDAEKLVSSYNTKKS